MKKAGAVAGQVGTQLRDRTRSIKLRVLAIARASRNKTENGKKKLQQAYVGLLQATSRVVGQAKKFSQEIADGVKRGNRKLLKKAKRLLDEMIPRVQQVMRQARQRVLYDNTRAEGKLVSVFEPESEVIRKGKAKKPNEFGKLVKIQETENQLITHYEGVGAAACRLDVIDPLVGATQAAIWLCSPGGSRRSRILFRSQRSRRRGDGSETCVHPGQWNPQQAAKGKAEETLVQETPEMAHGMRRPHQYSEASAWFAAIALQRT